MRVLENYQINQMPLPDLPPRVLIDFATKCNLRCPMCPVWGNDPTHSEGFMSIDNARRLINEIAAAKPLVQPNMYGEPLLVPDLKERILEMKEKGIAVALNTNGLTLTEDLAKFFVSVKLDSVMVSIDATTRETLKRVRGINALEKIERSVFTIIKERGQADYPRLGVSFTVQKENEHEAEDFVKKWTPVVDVVRVGLLFENGTFPGMKVPKKRIPCPALYNTLPVHNDGTVTVCCLDGFKKTNMGNVFQSGVKEVWNGKEFSEVRHYHETGQWDKVPFCKNCNGWAQNEYVEEIKGDLLIRKSPQYTYYNRISRINTWRGNYQPRAMDRK